MAIFPGAKWEHIPGHTDGLMRSYLGLVLHVNDANSYDLHDYFSRPDIEVSSHFQVTKDGHVFQYLDTKFQSWCQSNGNKDYLSVETQGFPSERLTDLQVSSLASLYKWLHDTHVIPYQLADKVGERGFAWHGMGGDAWGGHPGCPGDLRKAQRSHILHLAQQTTKERTLFNDAELADLRRLAQWLAGTENTVFNSKTMVDGSGHPISSPGDEIAKLKVSLAAIENKLGL